MDFYAYQRPLGKIDDLPALRDKFIAVFDTKDKAELVRFGLDLARHVLDITGFAPGDEVTRGLLAMEEWLDGRENYRKARGIGGEFYDLAREEQDPVKARFYRVMAQIVCIPHVKFHALWAADFAVTLVNRMHPGNLDAAENERQTQIKLLREGYHAIPHGSQIG